MIQKLHSAVITNKAIKGIVITSGTFSNEAITYANKIIPPIQLIDKHLLYDLAARARIELEASLEKEKVFTYPITDDRLLQNNIAQYIGRILESKPFSILDSLEIRSRKISLIPIYSISYSIDAVFETNIGVVHHERGGGKFFLSGETGHAVDEKITIHFKQTPICKLSSVDTSNITLSPFKMLSNSVKESALNHIVRQHTHAVTYRGRNNRSYSKVCEPHKKDIEILDISQVYIPNNSVNFQLLGKNRFFEIADNGIPDFYVYRENVSFCEICNKQMKSKGLLCNECGTITHNQSFFFSHGFHCKSCGKTMCRKCARYYQKFIFFKVPICSDCISKNQERNKKMTIGAAPL